MSYLGLPSCSFPKSLLHFKDDNTNTKLSAILATATSGLTTSCLTFVSFVDVRSFLSHVHNSKTSLIQNHFATWWPHGRDLMLPMLFSSVLSNLVAYRMTSDGKFAIGAALLGCIGPYTGVVLKEDIELLRSESCEEVKETTKGFCRLHHFRFVVAGVGFGLSLVGLAEL